MGVVGLPASAVDAWCEGAVGRRLEAASPRRVQGATILKYIVQVPAGSDPHAVAAALTAAEQELTTRINAHLGGTGFQVQVVGVTADPADQLSMESMPAEGSVV